MLCVIRHAASDYMPRVRTGQTPWCSFGPQSFPDAHRLKPGVRLSQSGEVFYPRRPCTDRLATGKGRSRFFQATSSGCHDNDFIAGPHPEGGVCHLSHVVGLQNATFASRLFQATSLTDEGNPLRFCRRSTADGSTIIALRYRAARATQTARVNRAIRSSRTPVA